MAKDPAILFYTSDFLAGTTLFTDEQVGQYIRLLCHQHQNGHLPELHMKNVCRDLCSPVVAKFKRDSDGNFFNERMEQEITKRVSYCDSRRNNISKRYNKNPQQSSCVPTYVLHMENGNRNRNSISNSSLKREEYEEGNVVIERLWSAWWLSYPKKEHAEVAKKKFTEIIKSNIATPYQLTDSVQRYNAYCMLKYDDYPNSQYIKFPENWLKDSCWTIDWKKSIDDEIKRQNTNNDRKAAGGRALYDYERDAASKYDNM